MLSLCNFERSLRKSGKSQYRYVDKKWRIHEEESRKENDSAWKNQQKWRYSMNVRGTLGGVGKQYTINSQP